MPVEACQRVLPGHSLVSIWVVKKSIEDGNSVIPRVISTCALPLVIDNPESNDKGQINVGRDLHDVCVATHEETRKTAVVSM